MPNLILYDDTAWSALRPLTFNKPVSSLLIGLGSIQEKWENYLNEKATVITQNHLSNIYAPLISDDNYLINGSVFPNPQLVYLIKQLGINEALLDENKELIAARFPENQFTLLSEDKQIEELVGVNIKDTPFIKINSLGDLLNCQRVIIESDIENIDREVYHQQVNSDWTMDEENIYIHETANIDPCFLDARSGPIVIGPNVKILAGAKIKGPACLGEATLVKMDTNIYGPFSCGKSCTLGGEIKNVILQDFSNKGHFGYIGDSLIGSHCNLGSGTSASNLKNTLTNVHLWDYDREKFIDSGRLKFGLIMGDFSKSAIHTTFNTGSIVGLSCNIFSNGFPRKFIPSFSWGGSSGYINYELEKALSVASATKGLKFLEMSESEKNMLAAIYKMTEKYRSSYN